MTLSLLDIFIVYQVVSENSFAWNIFKYTFYGTTTAVYNSHSKFQTIIENGQFFYVRTK